MRIIRIIAVVCTIALLLIAARITFSYRRFHRVQRSFSSVAIGDSQTSVVEKLGKPNYHEGFCGALYQPHKDCTLEYVYSHPFAPMVPDYYVVSFSSDHRVIESERWTSP